MLRHCPFFVLVVCFGLGIAGQDWLRWPIGVLIFVSLILSLAALVFFRRPEVATVFLLMGFMAGGALYSFSYQKFPAHHIYYRVAPDRRSVVQVQGVVASELRKKEMFRGQKISFELDVRGLKTGDFEGPAAGRILVYCYRDPGCVYGDEVTLSGRLVRPYDFSRNPKFSYRKYLRRRGIYFILNVKKDSFVRVTARHRGHPLRQGMVTLRQRLRDILKDHLSPAEYGVMQAVLIGDRSAIPPALHRIFVQTGTAHVLAISGLHVGIVAGLIVVLLRLLPVPVTGQYLLTMLFLAGYVGVTGARPSVVRAAVMAGVFLSGFLVERETDGLNSLSWAAFLILLLNPNALFDIGFQLSFLSVMTIILFYPSIVRRFFHGAPGKGGKAARLIGRSFAVSFSAWAGVAGLIAYYFDIVTPVTILANLLVVPLMTILVVLGFGLLAAGVIAPPMAHTFVACVRVLLSLLVFGIQAIRRIPGACFFVRVEPFWPILLYYLVLSAFCLVVSRRGTQKGEN